MSEKDPKVIQDELSKKKDDKSEKILTFDPTTGELVIKKPDEEEDSNNAVVVDQIYKDGFFNHHC